MSQTLDEISQSHKTMLFEEFTHGSDQDAPSLDSIIDKYSSMDKFGSPEFYREIEERLTVKTFEEFLNRFAPKVYEYVVFIDNIPHFEYTSDQLEAGKKGAREIKIEDHPFFKMLEQMYSQKGSSGLSNLDFPEDRVKEIFTPAARMEDIYRMRKQLRSLSIDYDKAKRANRDARPFALGIRNCRKEIRDKFKDSPLAQLALAIEEGGKKIKDLEAQIKKMEKGQDGIAPVLRAGRLGFGASGALEVRPVSVNAGTENASSQKALEEDRAVRNTLALVEGDINKIESADPFTKDLVISVYAPPQACREEGSVDLPALKEELRNLEINGQSYMSVYKQAQESFMGALAKSVRKLLNVYAFFDHATVKGGKSGKLPAGLLVANCKASQLIRDNDSKKRFERIMHKFSKEPGDSRIWLAILPDVAFGLEGDSSLDSMSEEDLMSEDLDLIPIEEEIAPGGDMPVDLARDFLKIMDDNGVTTVFNFSPDKSNTFAGMSKDLVENMEEKTATLAGNGHAVLAYPNFTLMGDGKIDLGGSQTVPVAPVYISASYVAAGLIAASQQEDVLLARKVEGVKLGSACARLDLEDADIAGSLHTKLNRELAYKWDGDIIEAINKHRFGFAFCSDHRKNPKTGAPFESSYILQARTFEKEDGVFQPIYRTLTLDFIRAYLNNYPDTADTIARLKKDADEWVKDCQRSENKGKVNLILKSGEKIEVESNGGDVSIDVIFNEGKASLKTVIKAKTNKEGEGK